MPANRMYVGTYTRTGQSQGIEVFGHDPASGVLTHLQTVPEVDPSFLTFDPSRRFLFATCEGVGLDGGRVASFAIDPSSGELTALSRQATLGGEPCHLTTDPSGRWLLVVNHEHGSVVVLPVGTDGRLGPVSDFKQHTGSGPGPTQTGPHAHHVTFDPLGKHVLVNDKGIDQVVIYTLDSSSGKLAPNEPAFARLHAGAAPRHLAFHPNGSYAYVNGEADMTVTTFRYDAASGTLRELQVLSTVPADAAREGASTAQILVDPTGRFVYVSNRGHDSIAIFAVDQSTPVNYPRSTHPAGHASTQGRTPRNFAFAPSGQSLYVANQNSNTIVHFTINPLNGQLHPTGQITQVGAPVCILFSEAQ